MYPGAHDPERTAIILAGTNETRTFGELESRSIRVANMLRGLGLKRGDVVAVFSTNHLSIMDVFWACARSGLYLTAINSHLSANEAGYILENSDAQVLFISGDLKGVAEELEPYSGNIKQQYVWGEQLVGFEDYETAVVNASGAPLADQPAGGVMLYSSGTTGRPKGVKKPLPDRQIHEEGDPEIENLRRTYGFDENTVYYSPAPMYHAAPLMYSARAQAVGSTVVVSARFDAEQALADIEKYQITHSQWVPTHFVRMLRLPAEIRQRYDVSSMQVALHAAAPCPISVKERMMDWWGEVLYEYYAATEGHGATTVSPQEWKKKPGTVGKAVLGVLHICDKQGNELPAGEVGTIYFENSEPNFIYHKDAAKTRSAVHPRHENWTTVGDLGMMDQDGYLFLTDRKAFMIISGGVNIYPQEIENELALHPIVDDVAVVGIADEEFGESVVAVIQAAEGANTANADVKLKEYLRERIAGFKVPKRFEFVERLPRTPTGKMSKKLVKQQLEAVAHRV